MRQWSLNFISYLSGLLKEIKPGAQNITSLGNLKPESNNADKENTSLGHEGKTANFRGYSQ